MVMQIPTRAMRAVIDPSITFSREELDNLVESQVIEEAAIRDTAEAPPLNEEDLRNLRAFILFRICAEIIPAGNA